VESIRARLQRILQSNVPGRLANRGRLLMAAVALATFPWLPGMAEADLPATVEMTDAVMADVPALVVDREVETPIDESVAFEPQPTPYATPRWRAATQVAVSADARFAITAHG